MGLGWCEGQGERIWRDPAYGAMGPQVVVLMTPVVDEQAGFFEGVEPVLVEAVITEGAVEGLDEGVLDGLTGLDVIEVDLAPLSPEVKRLARELRAVVTGDGTGRSQPVTEGIEQISHRSSSDGGIHMESQALAGAVIHQSQATEAPPSGKLIMDKVHGPAFVGVLCTG